MARKHEDKSYRIYYIIIPIGVLIVGFIINVIFDKYHETVLKNDTKEIITYLMTKDIETVEDYRAFAVELYKNKGYDDPENISVILGDDYLLITKYHTFDDLRAFFNIFHTHWFDKDGYMDNEKINEGMDKKTATVIAKYIAKINEYKEAEISEFNEDENEFFLREQARKAEEEAKKQQELENQENNIQ